MEPLNLPEFDIPDMKQKHLTTTAFQRWIIQNIKYLAESGQLKHILNNPARQPINVRFVL